MTFSVFARCDHSGYTAAPSGAKFVPGHFIKVNPTDMGSAVTRAAIVNFVNNTPTVRGVKVVKFWGELEISGALTGVGIDDWDAMLTELNPDKYLILGIANKCFGTNPALQLPLDLMTTTGNYTDASGTHMTYQYLWANKHTSGGSIGQAKDYYWKMWDTTLRARYAAFLDMLSAKYDNNPRVCRIDTLESSYGTQLIPEATTGFNATDYEDGWIAAYIDTPTHFTRTPYTFHTNFPRPFLFRMSQVMVANYVGLGAPNSNRHPGYLTTNSGSTGDPTTNVPNACGMVYYYPHFNGTLFLAPEAQGDDYESSTGNSTPVLYDYPSFQSIFERCRDVLHANTMVWLRIPGYWDGTTVNNESGVPHNPPMSLQTFLSTHPDIVAGGASGGLNTTVPTNLVRPA